MLNINASFGNSSVWCKEPVKVRAKLLRNISLPSKFEWGAIEKHPCLYSWLEFEFEFDFFFFFCVRYILAPAAIRLKRIFECYIRLFQSFRWNLLFYFIGWCVLSIDTSKCDYPSAELAQHLVRCDWTHKKPNRRFTKLFISIEMSRKR